MALEYTCIGDAGELSVVQTFNVSSTAIAHASAQTTDELVDNLLNGTLVRYTAGDTLRHKLLGITDIVLEITVT